jgi:thiamine-phosphate pyrophosphorylase
MHFPRVYAILDGPTLAARRFGLVEAAESLLLAGVRLIQIRWKETWTRDVYRTGLTISGLCRDASAALVVNDRIDIAMLLSTGAHVGQDDLPATEARRLLGPGPQLGISTHNEPQFVEALSAPVDYLAFGPVFGTTSKLNPDPVVGTDALRRLRGITRLPLVGIGGITRANAPEVWRAGADSVAVIGDLYPEHCTTASVRERAEEWIAIGNEHRD